MIGQTLWWAAALKGSMIFGAAGLAAALLRRRSAAARHLVWTAAFAAALALPLLSMLLPVWPVRAAASLDVPTLVFQTAATTRPAATPAATGTIPPSSGATSFSVDWPRWLMLAWAAGIAVSLAQIAVAWAWTAGLRRRATPLADPDFRILSASLGIRRPLHLLQTSRGSMPMAFGLLRPAIFLPAEAAEWTPERRRVVLLHELAHIQRGDLPLQLIAHLGLAVYWWNPLAWMAWKQFLNQRERAADDVVLQAGARASDYAAHLLEIARALRSPALASVSAMARRSQLEGRLIAILDSGVQRSAPRRVLSAAVVLLAVAAIAPLAAIRAQDQTLAVPPDVDATIRAATAEKNHQMLENAAKAAEVLQQYDLARRLLDSSLEIRSASGPQGAAYGLGLIKIGDLERSRGHFDEAQSFYSKAAAALGSRPEAVPALIHLGTGALHYQKSEEALQYFQQAQVADPAHAGPALMWMAVIQKQPDQALDLFKQALSQDEAGSPDAALTMELYAASLQRQNRADEAKTMRDQAAAVRVGLGSQAPSVQRGSEVKSYRVGAGVSPPALLSKVEPQYSEEARLAKYQGTVIIATVIGTDGKAQSMRVVRGLGLGLNDEALKAIAQWVFRPGAQDGDPVPVQATIEVNFRLL